MTRLKEIVGTWSLLDYLLVEPSGTSRPIWHSVDGRLTLTAAGGISAVITRTPPQGITVGEIIAYAGTFTLLGDEMKINVQVSNVLWHHTVSQSRRVAVDSSGILKMTLEGHPRGTHIVRWRKVLD